MQTSGQKFTIKYSLKNVSIYWFICKLCCRLERHISNFPIFLCWLSPAMLLILSLILVQPLVFPFLKTLTSLSQFGLSIIPRIIFIRNQGKLCNLLPTTGAAVICSCSRQHFHRPPQTKLDGEGH